MVAMWNDRLAVALENSDQDLARQAIEQCCKYQKPLDELQWSNRIH